MMIDKTKKMSKQIIQKEQGFVFAVTAMVVVLILSLILIYLRSTVMLNISEASEIMSTSQSYWSAVSGMEYAFEESVTDINSVPGTYSYYNSSITIDTSFSDNDGNAFTDGSIRFISTGNHGDTKRIVESSFDVAREQDLWPSISIILNVIGGDDDDHGDDSDGDGDKDNGKSGSDEDDESSVFKIEEDAILNCSIFIGGSVEVESDAAVGSPIYGGPTTIYVPTGYIVTGNFNSTFDWAVDPDPTPGLPSFNHAWYDSLIGIAESISGTGGNKHDGELEIKQTTFDLSSYANTAYFVKGDIEIEGSVITGGNFSDNGQGSPGILVSSGEIKIKEKHNIQSFIDNNIILISKKQIELEDYSQVGTDYSSLSSTCRPFTNTELYSQDDIILKDNSEVWAIVTSNEKLKLEDHAKLYGVAHTPNDELSLEENTYIEGAIFVLRMDHNKFKEGQIRLTHCFPMHFKSARKFVPVKTTFKEI